MRIIGDPEIPDRVEENLHDLDGSILKTWRLKNDPDRMSYVEKLRGFTPFMVGSKQRNTLVSHAKKDVAYQFFKIDRFELRHWFEQHEKRLVGSGGGIYICETNEQKRERLRELQQRFLSVYPHKNRQVVFGNNCESELKFGIEMGATVVRIRHPQDPHARLELCGPHFEVQDWYEVMELPFYRPQFEEILARRT